MSNKEKNTRKLNTVVCNFYNDISDDNTKDRLSAIFNDPRFIDERNKSFRIPQNYKRDEFDRVKALGGNISGFIEQIRIYQETKEERNFLEGIYAEYKRYNRSNGYNFLHTEYKFFDVMKSCPLVFYNNLTPEEQAKLESIMSNPNYKRDDKFSFSQLFSKFGEVDSINLFETNEEIKRTEQELKKCWFDKCKRPLKAKIEGLKQRVNSGNGNSSLSDKEFLKTVFKKFRDNTNSNSSTEYNDPEKFFNAIEIKIIHPEAYIVSPEQYNSGETPFVQAYPVDAYPVDAQGGRKSKKSRKSKKTKKSKKSRKSRK